jgi:hypothetical protein
MLNNHSVFHEPIEERTSVLRGPAVEPEGERIQVAIELPPLHSSVMASQQPALQKGRDPVDAGEDHRGSLAATSDDPGLGRPGAARERGPSTDLPAPR